METQRAAERHYAMDISEFIRTKRNEMKISQRVLAQLVGVTHGAVGQWESAVATPTIGHIVALKAIFGAHDSLVSSPGGKFCGEVVDDPDELAWLRIWKDANDSQRARLLLGAFRGAPPSIPDASKNAVLEPEMKTVAHRKSLRTKKE